MTSVDSKESGRASGGLLVVVLFAVVVGIFLVSYLPSRSQSDGGNPQAKQDQFIDLMNSGKNFYDQGLSGAEEAIEAWQQAMELNGSDLDVRLNLANANLLLDRNAEVIRHATEAGNIDPNSGAVHFLIGCANLRLGQLTEALQSFQLSEQVDETINALSYQLGRTYEALEMYEDAEREFNEVIQFDDLGQFPGAYYNLSQVLLRLGREGEAQELLEQYQALMEEQNIPTSDPSVFERCVYTEVRVPFRLEQPDAQGIQIAFTDVTDEAFGENASNFIGPVGILDIAHRGQNDLFVREKDQGFRLLMNTNGTFHPYGFAYPELPEAQYDRCLVGDLQSETLFGGRQEDVLVLGDQGIHVFHISTNGMMTDASMMSRLITIPASDGVLTDFDLTGSLDLMATNPTNRSLMYLRNLGNSWFTNYPVATNLTTDLTDLRQVAFDHWDNDDLLDMIVLPSNQPPQILLKQRGGGLLETNISLAWPTATAFAVGDLNNDLRTDLLIASTNQLLVHFQGDSEPASISTELGNLKGVKLIDYDNDGWLDIVAFGDELLRSWRNVGLEGFSESTEGLGLNGLSALDIIDLSAADFDGDCDRDLLITLADQSLRLLRNEGAEQNRAIKLRLIGNRTNPTGIGVRLEVNTGGLRLSRTVHSVPIEIGIGKRDSIDSIRPIWSSVIGEISYTPEQCETLELAELSIQEGSCPYLYAWDGTGYRFVTDLLGASPLGLPVAEGKLIEADTDELVWIGNESMFPTLDGSYVVQITEELREVLYLDEAKLVIVDHPAETEIHPTSKLVPGRPFPKHVLWTLNQPKTLLRATRSDGLEVTDLLQDVDGGMVSPVETRGPQFRGVVRPYSVTLEFEGLTDGRSQVLVLNGWLRFGGGMANIAGSLNADFPFPFPTLEAEVEDGEWVPVDAVIGAPAGKTKTILADLSGRLPSQTKRLKLTTAFEIHWDRMALMARIDEPVTQQYTMAANATDLHWRGYSEIKDLPWYRPLTPDYDDVRQVPKWLITPTGWCTRYGDVAELVNAKDDALVLLNGGDELTLSFNAAELPEKPRGYIRDFFLYTSGWDKDADFHVVTGDKVEPLPWHGMDDQAYGRQNRPETLDDEWIRKYNTRWVGQLALDRNSKSKDLSD